MKLRNACRVLVIAAAGFAASSTAVPSASAVDLAPGVYCDGARCTNDTAEAYIIHGFVTCSVLIAPPPPTGPQPPAAAPALTTRLDPWSEHFEPHTARDINPGCIGGVPMNWTVAGAYPRSQVPTGSAIPGFG